MAQDSAIQKVVDINIVSAVLLAKAAVPHMARGGAILFVSSYSAFSPAPPIAMWVGPPGQPVALPPTPGGGRQCVWGAASAPPEPQPGSTCALCAHAPHHAPWPCLPLERP